MRSQRRAVQLRAPTYAVSAPAGACRPVSRRERGACALTTVDRACRGRPSHVRETPHHTARPRAARDRPHGRGRRRADGPARAAAGEQGDQAGGAGAATSRAPARCARRRSCGTSSPPSTSTRPRRRGAEGPASWAPGSSSPSSSPSRCSGGCRSTSAGAATGGGGSSSARSRQQRGSRAHHADPPPGGVQPVPAVRPLHRHRRLRAAAAGDPPDARRHAHRPRAAHARRPGPGQRPDRPRAQAAPRQGDGDRAALRHVGRHARRPGRRRDPDGPGRGARTGGPAARQPAARVVAGGVDPQGARAGQSQPRRRDADPRRRGAQGHRPGARHRVRELLDGRVPDDEADKLAAQLSEGRWTHDYPIRLEEAEDARAARLRRRARAHLRADEPLPAPQPARPSVEFIPTPYRAGTSDRRRPAAGADGQDDEARATTPGRPTCGRRGTAATTSSAGAWTGCTSRTGSRRIRTRRACRCPTWRSDDSGLFDALARRRSLRAYGPGPLALGELSALLWAAAGVTERRDGFAFRTAPSAGGLYPVEHYVVANDVEGLERGLYHYDVLGRALERLVVADLRVPLANAALGQRVCADAQAVFVWTRCWSARAGSTASASPATCCSTPGTSPRTWRSRPRRSGSGAARSPPSSTRRRRRSSVWTPTRSLWST